MENRRIHKLMSRFAVAGMAITMAFAVAAGCNSVNATGGSGSPTTPTFPKPLVDDALAPAKGQESLVLAGGCFWGIQAVFKHVKGVTSSTSGYSGGSADTASYEPVSTGTTGHAASAKVVV